jgi:hypothetical protein
VSTDQAPARSGVLTARAWREQSGNLPLRIRVTYGQDHPDGTPAGPPTVVVVDGWDALVDVLGRWYAGLAVPPDSTAATS